MRRLCMTQVPQRSVTTFVIKIRYDAILQRQQVTTLEASRGNSKRVFVCGTTRAVLTAPGRERVGWGGKWEESLGGEHGRRVCKNSLSLSKAYKKWTTKLRSHTNTCS